MILLLLPLVLSCTSIQYGYQPVGKNEIFQAGEPGATFPVTVDGSEAMLHVMSLGIMGLKSTSSNTEFPALHLRMFLTNQKGDKFWVLNVSDQKVAIEGNGQSIPAYVKSLGLEAGTITVPPGAVRQVDLFYPLPKDRKTAQTFDGFDFRCSAKVNETSFEKTISFVRHETDRRYQPVYVNMAQQHQNMVLDEMSIMGPGSWWYNSQYPMGAFMGSPFYPMP